MNSNLVLLLILFFFETSNAKNFTFTLMYPSSDNNIFANTKPTDLVHTDGDIWNIPTAANCGLKNDSASVYVRSGEFSKLLQIINWQMEVPPDAYITGVRINIIRSATTDGILDSMIALLNNGFEQSPSHTTSPNNLPFKIADEFSPSPENVTYPLPGNDPLWGVDWTPQLLNANTFGISIQVGKSPSTGPPGYSDIYCVTVYIDFVRDIVTTGDPTTGDRCHSISCDAPNECQLDGVCNHATGSCDYPSLPHGSKCFHEDLPLNSCFNGYCSAGLCIPNGAVQSCSNMEGSSSGLIKRNPKGLVLPIVLLSIGGVIVLILGYFVYRYYHPKNKFLKQVDSGNTSRAEEEEELEEKSP